MDLVNFAWASVAELVDALDLGSSGVTRESSILSARTTSLQELECFSRVKRGSGLSSVHCTKPRFSLPKLKSFHETFDMRCARIGFPFHKSKTPSSLNFERNNTLYFCDGCA